MADGLVGEFKRRLPGQRKTQREGLALLVATMLDARSANLMDLAAALPRDAERADMRYQWITRVLGNPLIDTDAVMAPFAREVLGHAAHGGRVVLILDQSKLSDRHQVLMRRCAGASARCRWPGASKPRKVRSASGCNENCSKRWRPGCRRGRRCA